MIPKRFLLVVGTFLLMVLLYVDRACISVAKGPITEDLHFTDKQMAWVFAMFSLGYALFQTPGGMLADRFGPRRVLAGVVAFWSIFTGLTGAAFNLVSMLVVRFLFGVGEAGAFPGTARAVFSWVPMKERGLLQGINFSGSRLGAAFALPVVAWMIGAFGWRESFVILALVGFAWAAFWYWWFRDEPAEQKGISQSELDYIHANRQQAQKSYDADAKLPIARLFQSKNLWLAMVQYFCSNFTFFFCLTWLPSYLKSAYSLSTADAAFYAMFPLLAGAAGNWFSGWWIDRIYRRGHWELSRKLPAATGFAFAAVGLVVAVHMDTVQLATAFLAVAIFGADMTLSPSWSFCIDIGRKHAGAVSGTMNMAGNLGAFLTSLAFPYLQDYFGGSNAPFFYVGAGLNLLAIALWTFARPSKPLEEW